MSTKKSHDEMINLEDVLYKHREILESIISNDSYYYNDLFEQMEDIRDEINDDLSELKEENERLENMIEELEGYIEELEFQNEEG